MITANSRPCHLLHGGAYPSCRAIIDKFFEGYFSLQFIDTGTVELFYDQRRHPIKQPAFWFCWPGPRIRFHAGPTASWSHHYVAFSGRLPREWLRRGLIAPRPVPCPAAHVSQAIRRMNEIAALHAQPDPLAQWQAVNALESLILEITRLRRRQPRASFWAEHVASAWRAQMHRPVDYAALAAAHRIALSTFRRLFHAETGLSVHQYVQKLRTEEARAALELGHETQKALADRLGFCDVHHFNRQFRQQTGLAPAQYQQSIPHPRRPRAV